MPLYQYTCNRCAEMKEVIVTRAIDAPAAIPCPDMGCDGGVMRRQLAAPAFKLTGTGGKPRINVKGRE